ncbi:hypothetical protein DFH08DRAFT_304238 [Mycena albidolilacea]|uniref:C2H2-type domain-containing protein n=1 Tax=Mycena albidolilacea TaxID=1033008 RepID=A0AAD6ZP04_9AGAR|nr:hypothetical protein DFH08DRAFT_304238 [Mycena albidolilacea]
MPTNPLPYQCGAPGCTRKFEKREHLRQHTKDSHPPSRSPPKPPTFKCGVPGCGAAPFLQVSLLHQHTALAHPKSPSGSPLPKQPTFKCGVLGCEAAPFSQVSLLHRHTAQAHPKSPSGPSTLVVSTQRPIPVTDIRSTQAPVLMTQHVPPQHRMLALITP